MTQGAQRIVVVTTLNDNLFHAKLVPLFRARTDLEVVVVSDREGPAYPGVRWVWPGTWMRWSGRLGGRLLLLLREVGNPRTVLVMAYSVVPHGLFALFCGKLLGKPVYLHFIAGPAELEFAHDLRVTDNRLLARTRCPRLWEHVLTRCAAHADRLFVPGRVTASALRRRGLDNSRMEQLHSTVDTARYHLPPPSTPRDLDIVICAQLRERKRPLFTLQVLAEFAKLHPAARFHWLGDGGMHDEFARERMRLGLETSLGWTVTDDVAPYFRRGRVFLLCSLNEGLSLACLEAMACGCVPVCADCGDMAEAVIDGRTGRLLPRQADVPDYMEALRALFDDEALLATLSQAAHTHIVTNHSFAVAQQAWARLLEKLT